MNKKYILSIGICMLMMITSSIATANWNMERYDIKSSGTNLEAAEIIDMPELIWENENITPKGTMIISEDLNLGIITSDTRVIAINLTTFDIEKEYDINQDNENNLNDHSFYARTSSLIDGQYVYVMTKNAKYVYYQYGQPHVINGVATLMKINIVNEELEWRYLFGKTSQVSRASSPIIYNDTVYVNIEKGSELYVHAINPDTGNQNWEETFSGVTSGPECYFPLIYNNTLYTITKKDQYNGKIISININNHDENDESRFVSTYTQSTITEDGKIIYFKFGRMLLCCYDVETKMEEWYEGDYSNGISYPIVKGNKVYAIDDGFLNCRSITDGHSISNTEEFPDSYNDYRDTILISSENRIYILTYEKLICVDINDMEIKWSYDFGTSNEPKGLSMSNNGDIFVSKENTDIMCISQRQTPLSPSIPTGETKAYIDTRYKYEVETTTDLQDDDIYYQFDWGDGDTSDWLGPYDSDVTTISTYHIWNEPGEYEITVKAKDIHDNEVISDSLDVYVYSLEMELGGSINGIELIVENFDDIIKDIDWNIDVTSTKGYLYTPLLTGDFSRKMEVNVNDTYIALEPDEKATISTGIANIIGFGPIEITATIEEGTTEEQIIEADGFIIFGLVLIL